MRLTFIRHGQSTANAEGWIAGHADAPLTELGRAQALELRAKLVDRHFDRVLCSDLVRARETAAVVLDGRGLAPFCTAALRERGAGIWERRTIDDLEHSGDMALMQLFDGRPPGGESLRDVAVRVSTALLELAGEGDNLVVGHGALMRTTIGVLDRLPPARICEWKPNNCELATRETTAADLRAALAWLQLPAG
jgi:broad specificity phosphatase PhoE